MSIAAKAMELEAQSLGAPTLGPAFEVLHDQWRAGERDRELALHLMFLAWYLNVEPPHLTGLDETRVRTDALPSSSATYTTGFCRMVTLLTMSRHSTPSGCQRAWFRGCSVITVCGPREVKRTEHAIASSRQTGLTLLSSKAVVRTVSTFAARYGWLAAIDRPAESRAIRCHRRSATP